MGWFGAGKCRKDQPLVCSERGWPRLVLSAAPDPGEAGPAELAHRMQVFLAALQPALDKQPGDGRIDRIDCCLLQDEGVCRLPVVVERKGRLIPLFFYTEATVANAAHFAGMARLLPELGMASPVCYAPAKLPKAEPGNPLTPFDLRLFSRVERDQARPGRYAMWWPTGEEPTPADAPGFLAIGRFMGSLAGIESWFVYAFLAALGLAPADRNPPQLELPPTVTRELTVFFEAPEGVPMCLTASMEKGIHLLMHVDSADTRYRRRFWQQLAGLVDRFRQDLIQRGAPLDDYSAQDYDPSCWWIHTEATARQLGAEEAMEISAIGCLDVGADTTPSSAAADEAADPLAGDPRFQPIVNPPDWQSDGHVMKRRLVENDPRAPWVALGLNMPHAMGWPPADQPEADFRRLLPMALAHLRLRPARSEWELHNKAGLGPYLCLTGDDVTASEILDTDRMREAQQRLGGDTICVAIPNRFMLIAAPAGAEARLSGAVRKLYNDAGKDRRAPICPAFFILRSGEIVGMTAPAVEGEAVGARTPVQLQKPVAAASPGAVRPSPPPVPAPVSSRPRPPLWRIAVGVVGFIVAFFVARTAVMWGIEWMRQRQPPPPVEEVAVVEPEPVPEPEPPPRPPPPPPPLPSFGNPAWTYDARALVEQVMSPVAGRLIAVTRGQAHVLDLERQRLLRPLPADLVVVSPDGHYLAARLPGLQTIRVWSYEEGLQSGEVRQPGEAVRQLALTSGGSRLFVLGEQVAAWDIATGRAVWQIPSKRLPTALAADPGGSWIAVLVQETLYRIDADNGKILQSATVDLGADASSALTIALTPDGSLIAIGSIDRIVLWDTAAWRERHRFPIEAMNPPRFAIAPDASLIAVADGTPVVRLYRSDGSLFFEANQPESVGAVAFSADGARLATVSGHRLHLFSIDGLFNRL